MDKILGKIVVCDRLRIGTDGNGVVTLVALQGCPLDCKYCINKNLNTCKAVKASAEKLYNTVAVDDIYFQESGGGICFGGHEPLLQDMFIKDFKRVIDENQKKWKIYIETSLYVETYKLLNVINLVDYWIIDVKDMNPIIYKNYTGKDNDLVKKNLSILIKNVELHKIKIRLPLIEKFNSVEDREKSKDELLNMGFKTSNFDEFRYEIRADVV